MIQTIKLTDIVAKWRDALAASQEIKVFCLTKYGKEPKIYVGLNRKKLPGEKDCPLIIIRPGSKVEGEDEREFTYLISVGWGIVNEAETVSGNVAQMEGVNECDQLGQLIYEALVDANPSYPISSVNYEIDPIEFFPQFVGEMQLELSITPAIGGVLSY